MGAQIFVNFNLVDLQIWMNKMNQWNTGQCKLYKMLLNKLLFMQYDSIVWLLLFLLNLKYLLEVSDTVDYFILYLKDIWKQQP